MNRRKYLQTAVVSTALCSATAGCLNRSTVPDPGEEIETEVRHLQGARHVFGEDRSSLDVLAEVDADHEYWTYATLGSDRELGERINVEFIADLDFAGEIFSGHQVVDIEFLNDTDLERTPFLIIVGRLHSSAYFWDVETVHWDNDGIVHLSMITDGLGDRRHGDYAIFVRLHVEDPFFGEPFYPNGFEIEVTDYDGKKFTLSTNDYQPQRGVSTLLVFDQTAIQ